MNEVHIAVCLILNSGKACLNPSLTTMDGFQRNCETNNGLCCTNRSEIWVDLGFLSNLCTTRKTEFWCKNEAYGTQISGSATKILKDTCGGSKILNTTK